MSTTFFVWTLGWYTVSFFHLFAAIIAECLVAARQTLAAGFNLFKPDRQLPASKRNRIPEMFRVVGCMDIMTGPAGPAFNRLVDMDEMQILVAVTKTGQSGGKFLISNGILMTHEAELVITRLVWSIKKLGKGLQKHSEIIGSMGIMTG